MKTLSFALALLGLPTAAAFAFSTVDVTKAGLVGDGVTLNTAALQRAIDACSAQGGGVLAFPAGRFLTGTIQLKDNVTLRLGAHAVLLGSARAADYRKVDPFTDGTGAEFGYALVSAVDARHVGLEGPGAIDGQGAALRAAQTPYLIRPFLVRWVRCTDVTVREVELRNSGAWTMHCFQSQNARFERVTIRSRGLANNDGIDVDSSAAVRIADCDIDTGDDAICLKTTSARPCRDITVTGCRLTSNCAAVKLGTESLGDFEKIRIDRCEIRDTRLGGIKLLSVDGADLHDVVLSDLTMARVTVPIMLRLGARLKTFRPGDTAKPVGALRDVTIRNVRATESGQIGILISGVPDHPLENIAFENIELQLAGGGRSEDAQVLLAENASAYPEVRMFGPTMPAYGIYARHVRGLTVKNVRTTVAKPDGRPAAVLRDVEGLTPVDFAPGGRAALRESSAATNGLKVSANHRYLVDAKTGAPVFILADTAWNLGALKLEEVDTYLQSRADHGFNTVMFALSFAPQAEEKNAYGQPAYLGADKTGLNPAYFETCDAIIRKAADRGLYVVLYALWAGEKAGTMNHYTAAQLSALGRALGQRYAGVPNVIFCAGGEASPHYIEVERVNAIGAALKAGCEGRNLVTVHPVSEHSTSQFFAASPWLDFYLSQAKSGNAAKNTAYDAAALVLGDWSIATIKPTMMGEHRYESGTAEDPLIQRRSLYQCVFAGGFGYAYGHDALWQMSPHTAQPWMLKGWPPGVENWTQALDTPAVRQLHHIKALLYAHPYLTRIPDQSLVTAGQGADIFTRIQATRDGTPGGSDATYLMAYLSAPRTVTLNTAALAAHTLKVYWFNPATGASEVMQEQLANPGSLTLEKRPQGGDWVVVIEDAAKQYPLPHS